MPLNLTKKTDDMNKANHLITALHIIVYLYCSLNLYPKHYE